jgi:hypothetical protein
MKKLITILSFLFLAGTTCFAQDDDNDTNDKIRDKMSEFIQKRMGLNRSEAERFSPIFLRYFREWKTTMRENRSDEQLRIQRIAELRIRYRSEFKDIVGEKRCNQIYDHQEKFIRILRDLKEERIRRQHGPIRHNRSLLQ